MTITPSPQQADAIRAIVDWYRSPHREQQVFRLFGYAGTGKSTITHHAIEALGLTPMNLNGSTVGGVLFAAYTGKASLVMTRKGTPASTIHSLIYRVSEATAEEIARVEQEAAGLRSSLGSLPPAEQLFAMERLKRLELRLCDIHQPRFLLSERSLVREADLIVLDEVSMVGSEMAADLLAFRKPILVLGDPGQLPPIKGAGAFTDAVPDVMLTEIHRQASESAIIRLATMARQSDPIPYGAHDSHVWKMRRTDVAAEQLLRGGQVICGRNATRLHLNAQMKRAAAFDTAYPMGRGEKIICLKNRHDLGLINGMFVSLADIRDEDALSFSAAITTEDGAAIEGRQYLYKGHYDDHIHLDPERSRRDWKEMRKLVETVWATPSHATRAKDRSGRTSSSMTTVSAGRQRIGLAGFTPLLRALNRGS